VRQAMADAVASEIAELGPRWRGNTPALFDIYLALFELATRQRLALMRRLLRTSPAEEIRIPKAVPGEFGALSTQLQLAWAASRAPIGAVVKDLAVPLKHQSPAARWAAAQFVEDVARFGADDEPTMYAKVRVALPKGLSGGAGRLGGLASIGSSGGGGSGYGSGAGAGMGAGRGQAAEGPKEEPPPTREYPVWFGTNQVRDPSSAGKFTGEYTEEVSYGRIVVQVPPWHKPGETGSGFLKRWRTGKDDRLKVISTEMFAAAAFWLALAKAVADSPPDEREALVFIHGYNVGFDAAAIRAAQLGFDLKIGGAMAFFAWASKNSTARYTNDEAAIEASELHIEQFLLDFAAKTGATSVNLIAHSMGNRAVLRVMDRIAQRAGAKTDVKFGQIVLAAPDVTPQLFKHIAAAYKQLSTRTTIYVSSEDKALGLSKLVHGGARTGDSSSGVMIVDGLDTVVASFVDGDFLGHSYVLTAEPFLRDVFSLIKDNKEPKRRQGLDRVPPTGPGPVYWVMRG